MHILITGGAGFIGSHLVEFHLAKGDTVHAIDDLSTGTLDNLIPFQNNPNFRFDNANILTWPGLEKAASWADRIYHMAAVVGVYRVLAEPLNVMATNIAGTERLMQAVATSQWQPRVFLASSSEVYGHGNNAKLNEEDNLILESAAHSRWNYAITKLADEALGLAYVHSQKLPVTLIRFFNTVGPRQVGRYGMVVPRFVRQAFFNEPITVFGDGTQTRCFCDVRDTVVMLDLLADNEKSIGEIINVGNDREISMNDLAQLICKLAKSTSTIQHIPYNEAYGEEYHDILHRRPDLAKLVQLTKFKHQWSLEQTIQDLLSRLKQNKG